MENFGIAALGNGIGRKIGMGFTTIISILILCLFIAAMAGWTTDTNNIQKAAWATAGGKSDTYIGLQMYYSTEPGSVSIKYSDATNCPTRGCTDCLKAGQAALGLLLTSFFMFLFVAVTSGVRVCKDSAMLKIISLGLTLLVWIFSVAAFGNWNTNCYNNINSVDGLALTNEKYFMGYGAAVSGWVFTTFVFIMHLLTPVAEQSSAAAATTTNPTSDGPAKV